MLCFVWGMLKRQTLVEEKKKISNALTQQNGLLVKRRKKYASHLP